MIKVRKSKAMREVPGVSAGAEGAGGVSTRPNSADDTDDFLEDRLPFVRLDENIDEDDDVDDDEEGID